MSGGKDSFLATLIAMERGFDVQYSISFNPEPESMMFHIPNIELSSKVAGLLDLDTRYFAERDFEKTFSALNEDGIRAVISGAIASDYQKDRIERVCTECGLLSVTPLWRLNPYAVLEELILRGVGARIVSVSAEGLDRSLLGTKIDRQFVQRIRVLSDRYGINPCGEGGEYETIVETYAGKRSVSFKNKVLHWEGASGYLVLIKD